jgi:DNA-binding MarR family transcriptional regulator
MGVEAAGRLADAKGRKVALLHQLLKLTNRLMAPFSTHLAHRHRISLNEFRMLMTIGALGRTASHELAELTGVNVMSVSRAVSTLERHGRIEIRPDPANRRRKWLALTEEGGRLYAAMRPQSELVADYLFSELSAAEIGQLDRIVDRLIATLEAKDAAGQSLFIERTKPDVAPND